MSHGGKRRHVDSKTDTVAAHAMEKIANLSLGRVLGELREGVQMGLDSAVFGAKSSIPNRAKTVSLVGKLRTETDGVIAMTAGLRTRVNPRADSVDSMGDIADHE